jgi:hypothetical protein
MPRHVLFPLCLGCIATLAPAQTTVDAPLVEQLSVMGTIRGGDSPTLRDTVVLLDVITGKTEVLAKGACLKRLPTVCVREIHDKTILVSQSKEGAIEIAHIEGEQPRSDSSGGGGSGSIWSGSVSEPPPPPDWDSMPPPPSSWDGMPPPPSSWDPMSAPPPPPPPPAWMVPDDPMWMEEEGD